MLRRGALAAKLKLVQVPLELLKGREFRLIGYPMDARSTKERVYILKFAAECELMAKFTSKSVREQGHVASNGREMGSMC